MALNSSVLAGIAIGIVIVIFIAGFILHDRKEAYWILTAVLMIFFLGVIGKAVNGRWTGILIDERKVMSLSRFQIVIWTVIILSAFLTIATAGIFAGKSDPLNIKIDWHLWALLGISSTSLVGTPLILDDKKKKTVRPEVMERNQYLNVPREGIVFKYLDDNSARFTDMFEGDETGNQLNVDMSKVQMFFFTVISALSYIVLLFNEFLAPGIPTSLPVPPEGLIAILTISHGTYLTYKIADHTPGVAKQIPIQ